MADKVIGVDVGTNAVRAAEVALGAHPKLLRFGQVALPPGAVVEGEVADGVAVADALRRLWREAGFRSKSVRVGIASARVILRVVEVPDLSEDDTRSALSLQLGDYVPMAPESTVFGFQPIAGPDGWAGGPDGAEPGGADQAGADTGPGSETDPGEDGPDGQGRQQRLLLAAAHRDAVTPLVDAVQQAGLKVAAVDVIPAALARVLVPTATDGVGPPPVEAIVSLGAGTTLVVVARGGTPLFARTVTSVAGRQCTERLADALSMSVVDAERAKRSMTLIDNRILAGGAGGETDLTATNGDAPGVASPVLTPVGVRADGRRKTPAGDGSAVEDHGEPPVDAVREATRPLVAELVGEVADSLDYYSSQPGAVPVDRVVLTGGGMRLAGVGDLLGERLGLPVVDSDPYARLAGLPAGFEPVDLPFLAPYLPAPVGIALGGGRKRAIRIDLLPDKHRRGSGLNRLPLLAAAVAAIVLVAAAGLYWQRRSEINHQEQAAAAASLELSRLAAAAAAPAATDGGTGVEQTAVLRAALAVDPDWLAATLRLDEIDADLGIEIRDLKGSMDAAPAQGSQAGGTATTTTTASTATTAAGSTATTSGTGAQAGHSGAIDPATGVVTGATLGTLTVTATALDLAAVASWLEAVEADDRFAQAWVSAIAPAAGVGVGESSRVQFTAEVRLTGQNLVPRTLREPPR